MLTDYAVVVLPLWAFGVVLVVLPAYLNVQVKRLVDIFNNSYLLYDFAILHGSLPLSTG